MKVRLVKQNTIDDFVKIHANGKIHFDTWLFKIKLADWMRPSDIAKTYKSNLLSGSSNRVIFDLGGNSKNSFRMICDYLFGRKYVHLYINWIGTHEEYNQLSEEDKKKIAQY